MSFKQAWEKKLSLSEKRPQYIRDIISLEYKDFKRNILECNDTFIEKILNSLLEGDIYIIRNVISEKRIMEIKKTVFKWSQSTEDNFYKILEKTPNFHRKIDSEIAKNYNYNSVWNINYFFRWNKDSFNLFDSIDDCWSLLKTLNGYDKNDFLLNTPKDIIVDRLQIHQYPKGGGFLELHSDPYEIMKTLACIKMSKKGIDYDSGGLYFMNSSNNHVNIEDQINIGDLFFSFPSVKHGIDQIDSEYSEVDWSSSGGRWTMLLTILHSNEIKQNIRASTKVY